MVSLKNVVNNAKKGIFEGSELQWENWAAHEIQLQQSVSPIRRKKLICFWILNILPRG